MNILIALVPLVCLGFLIRAIYTSSKRWLSFGYAVGAFGLVFGLGLIATLILAPSGGSIVETNGILDMIGAAINILAPTAALVAANMVPRR